MYHVIFFRLGISKSDMIWVSVLLACWAATGAAAQDGCYIESEPRRENSCHRKIICKRHFSPVSNPSRCYVYRGSHGTDLSLYNFTQKSIKMIDPLMTVDHKIEKFNAAFNNWMIIHEDDFSFCKNARFLNISHNGIQHLQNGSFYSLTKLEVLDLSNNRIHRVMRMHFTMNPNTVNSRPLKTLLFAHNNITFVENDAFADLHALEHLDLSDNKIMKLNSESFNNLHFLTKLKLENNLLRTFDDFKDLINLRYINVSNNQLTHIHVKTYIVALDASHNNVSEVDLNMFDKSIMPSVDLSHNNLRELRNTSLKDYGAIGWSSGYYMKLDLSFNVLSHIDYNAFLVFYNILTLDLSHNKLHTLMINSKYLKHLTELRLQNNNFNYISSRMFEHYYNLKYLDMSNNELSVGALHRHSFASLHKLTTLKIANNDIRIINETTGLDGLTNLVEFEMFNNSLHSVNFTGARCHKLSKLSLRHNNITNLKNVELHELLEIHDVDISENHIEEIHTNSFQKLNSLKHLNLSNNLVSTIHPAAFLDLYQLKTLDLSKNNIKSINYGSFQGLVNVQLLDLSSNKLPYVKMNAFLQLTSLSILLLDDNNMMSLDHSSYRIARGSLALSIGGNHLSCDWLSAAVWGQLPGHPSITIQSKIQDYSHQGVNGILCQDYKPADFDIVGNTIPIGLQPAGITNNKLSITSDTVMDTMKKQTDIMKNIEGYVKEIKELMDNKDDHMNTYGRNDEFSPEDMLLDK